MPRPDAEPAPGAPARPGRRGLVLSWLLLVGCAGAGGEAPTFNRDVAPIVHGNCATCHRPGGGAPFDLLAYPDVRKRARQIVEVTATGYMPPWLPAAGSATFDGARRLNAAEIATLARWVETGRVEGDPAELPSVPEWPAGWRLGEPDLVVAMESGYALAPEGRDVYRNFVLRLPVATTRWVRAVEFDPGTPNVVHHARILVDRTPASRSLDAASPNEPGFGGMDPGVAESPEGHLLGWTPGKRPHAGSPDLAWRLDPGDDLVVQLHMVPSGRSETVRARAALYFAERAPQRAPYALVLGTREIDIPAGDPAWSAGDHITLPVDVELLAIYPHAHYLGKRMQVEARLPDGSRRSLLQIERWDFNWQDEYRYTSPIALPAGTEIVMNYTWDNSAANPFNPHQPPRRVVYGAQTTDEMGELMLQLLPREASDLARLRAAHERHRVDKAIRFRLGRIAEDPGDAASLAALAASYLYMEDWAAAARYGEAAARLAPGDAKVRQNLAYALRRAGRTAEAIEQYRAVLRVDPDFAAAHFDLAAVLRERGRLDEALEHYRATTRLRPDLAVAFEALAEAAAAAGRPDEAATAARRARALAQAGTP